MPDPVKPESNEEKFLKKPREEVLKADKYLLEPKIPSKVGGLVGEQKIEFAFVAFINGTKRGEWLQEPGVQATDHRIEFHTDPRDFGEFDEKKRNARLFSVGWIWNTSIGAAQKKGAGGDSGAGDSEQRLGQIQLSKIIWNPPVRKTAKVEDGKPEIEDTGKAKTTIRFQPEAEYPFVTGVISPAIDYDVTFTFEVAPDNSITVTITGDHNLFPDYEAYVNKKKVYEFFSPDSGPDLINLNRSTKIRNSAGTDGIKIVLNGS